MKVALLLQQENIKFPTKRVQIKFSSIWTLLQTTFLGEDVLHSNQNTISSHLQRKSSTVDAPIIAVSQKNLFPRAILHALSPLERVQHKRKRNISKSRSSSRDHPERKRASLIVTWWKKQKERVQDSLLPPANDKIRRTYKTVGVKDRKILKNMKKVGGFELWCVVTAPSGSPQTNRLRQF